MSHNPLLIIERPLGEEQLCGSPLLRDEDRSAAAALGCGRRRCEYLMWRLIVRRELGADVDIAYTESGRPLLVNRNEYIGVSHNDDFVAVVVSPHRCAVDIERLDRNFSRVAERYISPRESELSDDPRLAAALWCAKETLYKYADAEGADFLRDIVVERVDFGAGIVAGRVRGGDMVEMRMFEREGSLVVYVG